MNTKIRFEVDSSKFSEITGSPLAYYASDNMRKAFQAPNIASKVDCKSGIAAGDDTYIKLWFEVDLLRIKFDCCTYKDMADYKWFPMNSGGDFRKWYGNHTKIVDLWRDGYNIRNNVKNYRLREKEYYFQKGITWGRITSAHIAFRDVLDGTLFGDAGPIGFVDRNKGYILAMLSSNVVAALLECTNPTLNFQIHDVMNLPLILDKNKIDVVEHIVEQNIQISKKDWDSFELCWNFKKHPLL